MKNKEILGKYVHIRTGKLDANAADENGIYPFFTCAKEPSRINVYAYDCDCVLVAGNGDLNVKYYNGKFNAYQRTYIIESNSTTQLYTRYLYWFLSQYIEKLRMQSIGGTIKFIKLPNLTNAPIYIPSLSEQHNIVYLLDTISQAIEIEKRILFSYDELIKSRFIELFEKIKTTKEMSSICKIITDGTHQPPIFSEKGIPFLFVTNIKSNEIDYNTQKYITKEIYDVLVKRTPIEKGDILLSTVGSYGHPAIVKSSQPFCFQRHIAYLKPDVEQVNSIYLHSAILTDNIQNQIEDNVNGVAQKTLNLSAIKKIKVPIPPLALQNSFAAFVQEIDKLKFISQKKIQYLEELLSKQMDTYFG